MFRNIVNCVAACCLTVFTTVRFRLCADVFSTRGARRAYVIGTPNEAKVCFRCGFGAKVETTGLADPAPVAQTFFVDDEIKHATRLDAIITVFSTMDIHFIISIFWYRGLWEIHHEGILYSTLCDQLIFANRIWQPAPYFRRLGHLHPMSK